MGVSVRFASADVVCETRRRLKEREEGEEEEEEAVEDEEDVGLGLFQKTTISPDSLHKSHDLKVC